MKKLVFISTLILLGFSCKKERLNDNKELLVGKWELDYAIHYWYNVKRSRYEYFDTLIPGINANNLFITFKKAIIDITRTISHLALSVPLSAFKLPIILTST